MKYLMYKAAAEEFHLTADNYFRVTFFLLTSVQRKQCLVPWLANDFVTTDIIQWQRKRRTPRTYGPDCLKVIAMVRILKLKHIF